MGTVVPLWALEVEPLLCVICVSCTPSSFAFTLANPFGAPGEPCWPSTCMISLQSIAYMLGWISYIIACQDDGIPMGFHWLVGHRLLVWLAFITAAHHDQKWRISPTKNHH